MKILFDAPTLAQRVAALGDGLRERFSPEDEVVAIIVLRGAMFFAADLLRTVPTLDVRVSTLRIASYAGTRSGGKVHLLENLSDDLDGRHVVVIEDIIDTGRSIAFLRRHLAACDPASITVVTLLDKPSRREVEAEGDLVGFTIEDHFVVGYGLDLDQRYRHLPHIATLSPEDEA